MQALTLSCLLVLQAVSAQALPSQHTNIEFSEDAYANTSLVQRVHGQEVFATGNPWKVTAKPVAMFRFVMDQTPIVFHGYPNVRLGGIAPWSPVMILAMETDLADIIREIHDWSREEERVDVYHIAYACPVELPEEMEIVRTQLELYFPGVPVSETSYPDTMEGIDYTLQFLAVQRYYGALNGVSVSVDIDED